MSALEGLAIRRLRRAARDGARTTEDERFRALIENHSDVVSLVDTQGRIGFLTPSSARVLGHDPGELEGRSLFESVHPDDTLRVRAFLDSALTQPGVTRPVEWRARRSDGGWVHLETIGNNLLDDPAVGHLVLFSRDIGERKAFETQLAHQAFHDPLTGLANRSLLKDRVQRALLRDGEPCSLLFLDLDNFKHVNDSLGHDAGDTLLVEVSDRIRQCLRPGDTAARLGGDEFAILLENAHAVDDAVRVAERITDLLQAPITVGARTAFTATSVGIARSVGAANSEELLRNADIAMYKAKSRGKGQHAIFQPDMHTSALRRIELESALRGAVARDELVLHYQPIVALASGRIVGLEALVRWAHPQQGLLLPDRFIPIAEETGLIEPIGEWVIGQAASRLAAWQHDHPHHRPLAMAVNLSGRQLESDSLTDNVSEVIRTSDINAASMVIEITETVMMKDTEKTASKLADLKALGVQLAVDDFGIGYSSLHYLHTFPIDLLKVAREFVEGLSTDEHKSAFTKTIMELCQTLGLPALAEGVESNVQAEALRGLRCGLGQGFYLSRPLDEATTGALLGQGLSLGRYVEEVHGHHLARESAWWQHVTGRSAASSARSSDRRRGQPPGTAIAA